jgi:hypothetical protein
MFIFSAICSCVRRYEIGKDDKKRHEEILSNHFASTAGKLGNEDTIVSYVQQPTNRSDLLHCDRRL